MSSELIPENVSVKSSLADRVKAWLGMTTVIISGEGHSPRPPDNCKEGVDVVHRINDPDTIDAEFTELQTEKEGDHANDST